MAATTAGDILNEALADLGVIRPGETVSATVTADLLLRLNQLIGSLSAEELMSAQNAQHSSHNLVSGIARYTVGIGGTFNTTARPEKITGWRAVYGAFQSGGRILTFEELQEASKDGLGSQTSIPSAVGADAAQPLLNLAVFPIPNNVPGTIELSWWKALTQFATAATALSLSSEWENFLHFQLAVMALPRYGRQGFNPTVLLANAQNAKQVISDLARGRPVVQAQQAAQ